MHPIVFTAPISQNCISKLLKYSKNKFAIKNELNSISDRFMTMLVMSFAFVRVYKWFKFVQYCIGSLL